jgi:hypothetical protein
MLLSVQNPRFGRMRKASHVKCYGANVPFWTESPRYAPTIPKYLSPGVLENADQLLVNVCQLFVRALHEPVMSCVELPIFALSCDAC